MSGTADPHEPPCSPALLGHVQRTPSVERSGGPERVVTDQPQPNFQHRPVGFAPPATSEQAAIARVLAICDEWDALSKGESATTARIRRALATEQP